MLTVLQRSTDVTKKEICCKLDLVIAALGGAVVLYNTENAEALAAGATNTYSGAHQISILVVQGTADVSFDGGLTTVTYPQGSSINREASTTFASDIVVTASASGGDTTIVNWTTV